MLNFHNFYLAIPTCMDSPPLRTVKGPIWRQQIHVMCNFLSKEILLTATVTITNASILGASHANIVSVRNADGR